MDIDPRLHSAWSEEEGLPDLTLLELIIVGRYKTEPLMARGL